MVLNGCNPECPACRYRHLPYPESVSLKREWLVRKLLPWAHRVEPVVSMTGQDRWHYRNKVCLNTRYENNRWQFGMMRRDNLIPLVECPVHSKEVNRNLDILSEHLPSAENFPLAYFVQVNALVTLVLKCRTAPDLSWVDDALIEKFMDNKVSGLAIHLNPSAGKRLFENTVWLQIFGESFARDDRGYWYSRTTFQQVIPDLHHMSLIMAGDFLKPGKNRSVLDLYCGTGISMSHWLNTGASVLGIETGGDSVECAMKNAPGATVLRGSCRTRIPHITEWIAGRDDVLLYANPPRTGLESEVMDLMISEAKPAGAAYLSCSAGTLRRDLEIMTTNGYDVDKLVPYDFFPWTHHIECLALLRRKGGGR